MNTERLMNDFINEGFEAIVVSGRQDVIDKEWIGHKVDKHLLEYLRKNPGVDVCGENGEYHTFVTGGPLFKGRIDITSSGIIERDNHWFLDIKDFKVSK
jgi:diphthamide synthase (EF-2-diphthine--ammonia ligase)